MRLLFVGDVVGRSGRAAVTERLPGLKRDWKLDCVIVNGENAAGGFGITEPIYNEMIDAGADAITGGNHSWDQREALVFIERAPRLIRPLNYPPGTPGRGMALVEAAQRRARAGDQPDGPRVHGPARRSVRGGRARALRLSAEGRGRRDRDRHALRGDEREAGDGPFLRRPREPRGRHPHPCADRRSPRAAGRHRLHHRCRHDRRLRFRHRHEQGRAAAPFHAPHPVGQVRARERAGDACARSRSRPTTRPGSRRASRRCGSAGSSHEARPAFWE